MTRFLALGLAISATTIVNMSAPAITIPTDEDSKKIDLIQPLTVRVSWKSNGIEDYCGTAFWYCPGQGSIAVIVTARHCASPHPGDILKLIGEDGVTYSPKQIYLSKDQDIAVIYVGDIKGKKPLDFSDKSEPLSSPLWAMSYPLMQPVTFAKGYTNSEHNQLGPPWHDMMGVSMDLTHGSSGSMVINRSNQIAGLFTCIPTDPKADGLQYCIPAPIVKKEVLRLMEKINRAKG